MILTILTFIIILGVLVLVHEFGHFIVAKKSGMAVEEFGFGFPPRLVGLQKADGRWRWVWGHKNPLDVNQTVYSINWIPFGGFVKIRGENNESADDPQSFINRPFWGRLLTLVAGVVMNVLLAFVIFTVGYNIGLPVAVDSANDLPAHAIFYQPQLAILDVVKGLPADQAGLKSNDIIVALDNHNAESVKQIQSYVQSHAGSPINFLVNRSGNLLNLSVTPSANPPKGQGPTGIVLSQVGLLRYPFLYSISEGAKTTVMELGSITSGLYQLVSGKLGLSNVGGPVKIAKLTGQVRDMGFIYLLQFTAFLSLNLAVLNILPFPALDGGRVLFLIIEKIRRKRNNQKLEQWTNTLGFVLLIMLMVAVTINDIVKK